MFSITRRSLGVALSAVAASGVVGLPRRSAADSAPALPSWNDGPAKRAILDFVQRVTTSGGPDFVAPEDRIATFDQAGTLWVEHPLYGQAMFALDRVRTLAPEHPEWKSRDPFAAVLSGDLAKGAHFTEKDWTEIIGVTHSGISNQDFKGIVKKWLETAEHPRFKRKYTELVYQPMREVMDHLRANGFRTYIVTGGGQEFVRAFAQAVYGVPPEQVVGSSGQTRYEVRDGKPVLMKVPKVLLIDDKGGKPEAINLVVGRRPVAAFGNSDGDREMLEYTQGGGLGRLMMLVRHDDADREYAYGAKSKIGTFSEELMGEAKKR